MLPHETLAAFALALGAFVGAVYLVRVHGASINREAFELVIRRLLAVKNGSRAIKLCRAAPYSPLCGAMQAALLACRDGNRPAREQTDYRHGALDDSPEAVLTWLNGVYDEGFASVARRFESARVFAIVAASLFVVVAAGASFVEGVSRAFAIAAVFGLFLLAHAGSVERRIHRDRVALFAGVSDHLYQLARAPESFADEPNAPPVPDGRERLVFTVTEPGEPMRTFECATEVVKIGRDPRSHLRLESKNVSRMHAVIERTRDGATIIDLGDAAGTVVNGKRVNKCTLENGDLVVIADVEMRASFPDRPWRGANVSTPG
jgi:hypothetical protein